MISQSLATKLVAVGGQVLLAYLLLPEHFAAISLTYTVTAFARVFENGGLRDVLLQRGSQQGTWWTAGFWLSLLLGCVSGLLIALAAPVAAWMYGSRETGQLLLWLAPSPVIVALATIPLVQLQGQHRFRLIAGMLALQGLVQTAVTVWCASRGFEAFSFVVGTLVSSMVYTASVWFFSPSRVLLEWRFADWQALWGDTFLLSLIALVTTITQQVDYVLLGIFHSKQDVGQYFFAYSLATQITQVLGANMSAVFLPVLCKLQADHRRQLAGSLDAFRMVAVLGIPLAFLQCALTSPGFRIFLPVKWLPAIPLAQVLTLGLGLNLLSGLCWSLLKAQGRFRVLFHATAVFSVVFALAVALVAGIGTPLGVAWCVFCLGAAYSPLVMWLGISPIGGTWRDVGGVYFLPLAGSVTALAASFLAQQMFPFGGISDDWWRLAGGTAAFVVVYAAILLAVGHPLLGQVRSFLKACSLKSTTVAGNGSPHTNS